MKLIVTKRQLKKASYVVLSIGTLSKKNQATEPNMEHVCGSACITSQMKCWRKPASTTVVFSNLQRCDNDENYGKSLSDIGWTDEQIIQYDELALEDHSHCATREECTRNDNLGTFVEYSVQGPLNQLLDFVEAKRETGRLRDEHVKETS